jgi:hypothetical protein
MKKILSTLFTQACFAFFYPLIKRNLTLLPSNPNDMSKNNFSSFFSRHSVTENGKNQNLKPVFPIFYT